MKTGPILYWYTDFAEKNTPKTNQKQTKSKPKANQK